MYPVFIGGRYTSTAPVEDYRGAVLINPGGPGGSGVIVLQTFGPLAAALIGAQYDIVSFDPRGVGASTPRFEFFLTEAERALWLANPYAYSTVLNVTNDPLALPRMWANSHVLGQMAKDRDTSGILEYGGTDNVARDMLRITEANGQDMLLYYGVSYGATLGATFASMFPDRVGRMVIDGVPDVQGYYASNDWRNGVLDADRAMQTFFNGCYSAGPNNCAFYASSPSEIESNLNALYASVLGSPVPVYSPSSPAYGVVDYSILRNAVKIALSTPFASFSILAQGLTELAAGNGTIIYEMQLDGLPFECSSSSATYLNTWEAQFAVACGDGVEVTDSVADLEEYWKEVSGISTFADTIIWVRVGCSGWKVHREGRFLGPISGNTSFPLLVIGNTADPVTPLASAKNVSKAFPGSVVLTQDSPGHTSTVATSTCLYSYISACFQNGTLPAEGTVCAVDEELFPSAS
ncbi:alpha/beta-hydrolase [Hymenopellis radicata]|nr:alpha/beta-hydrolase [Hymenopellis radicata]